MTTKAAAAEYLAAHLKSLEGKGFAVVNPENKPVEELPVIYGFNNGGGEGWYEAMAIAEDGEVMGGHICSHESYMPHDLGCLEGTREDRHVTFAVKYPGGYRMEFVPTPVIKDHKGLNQAFAFASAAVDKANSRVQ